ncbi:hypothetical protein [Ascidiaceihabitans sp.]|uniref:hypothetical protein n=1 Tax=Ascidiaceihabitans sp. TaxID=1872644 RepID=UPI0032980795
MTRILKALRTRFATPSSLQTHMAVHGFNDAEFADRGMKRTDVARMIMTNAAW